MLLGPYTTEEEANEVCNCPKTPCPAEITISGPCGIEVSNGVAYSIGTQNLTVSKVDSCGCIDAVIINGQSSSYLVNDGDKISVFLDLVDDCIIGTVDNPQCVLSMFGMAESVGGKVRMKLNSGNVAKYLLSRRRRGGSGGK